MADAPCFMAVGAASACRWGDYGLERQLRIAAAPSARTAHSSWMRSFFLPQLGHERAGIIMKDVARFVYLLHGASVLDTAPLHDRSNRAEDASS